MWFTAVSEPVRSLLCMTLCGYTDLCACFFFFQAEDGIRDLVRSRGLGDVYKRQQPARRGDHDVGPAAQTHHLRIN